MTTAIFLDRDGVINQKAPANEYVTKWSDVRILPGALAAIRSLHEAGFKIFIVTNQRGIATGRVKPRSLAQIHRGLRTMLKELGVSISDIYSCPHDNSANCSCRKPKPGMLLRAAQEHDLQLSDCWMVGDMPSDIEAGKSAGCRTAWISSPEISVTPQVKPDVVADSLESAVKLILEHENRSAAVLPSVPLLASGFE